VDGLLPALRGSGLQLLLAAAAGAALALVGAALVRGRRHGTRLQRLAGRAARLAAGAPPAALTDPDVLAGRGDLAELARAFHAMEQRLLEDRSGREAFTTRALEELKAPLGLLSTSLDLALRRRPEVPELTAALRDAQREAERISRLATRITTLQGLARAVQRVPMDLAPLARHVYQVALPAATQRGLALRLAAPPSLPMRGDAAALTQALAELVANGVQASRYGGAVVLTIAREGALVHASVRDEGPGIPRERRKQVFEPFGHGAHGWSAASTGLAIVREVARAHGGTASAEDVEVGALLLLELPAD
jgi:signal transduction histidine kinase